MVVKKAYQEAGIGDRFAMKVEIRDRLWFDGFIPFMEANLDSATSERN